MLVSARLPASVPLVQFEALRKQVSLRTLSLRRKPGMEPLPHTSSAAEASTEVSSISLLCRHCLQLGAIVLHREQPQTMTSVSMDSHIQKMLNLQTKAPLLGSLFRTAVFFLHLNLAYNKLKHWFLTLIRIFKKLNKDQT